MANFGEISDDEISDLARILHQVLAKLYFGLEDPDFTYTIRTAPAENAGVNYYHWYVSIVPLVCKHCSLPDAPIEPRTAVGRISQFGVA
jgi:UDPglucose--hexose-1-phosphate uridylyltransferase